MMPFDFCLFFLGRKRLGVWRDQVHKQEVSSPSECTLHLLCGGESCSTWPGFRRFIFFPPAPLYLHCSHKVIPTCLANRVKQMRWFWLEGRATVTRGPVPRRESRLEEVGWERLCRRRQRRGESGLMRRDVSALPSSLLPPPQVTYQRIVRRDESTLPFFLPPRYFCVHFSSLHSAEEKHRIGSEVWVRIQHQFSSLTVRLMHGELTASPQHLVVRLHVSVLVDWATLVVTVATARVI